MIEEFTHEYWLEIFLLQDMTANSEQIEKLRGIVDRIAPLHKIPEILVDYCYIRHR